MHHEPSKRDICRRLIRLVCEIFDRHGEDHEFWMAASILPMLFVAGLVASYQIRPLFWLQGVMDLDRNHFDRLVHFAFGLLLAYPAS